MQESRRFGGDGCVIVDSMHRKGSAVRVSGSHLGFIGHFCEVLLDRVE